MSSLGARAPRRRRSGAIVDVQGGVIDPGLAVLQPGIELPKPGSDLSTVEAAVDAINRGEARIVGGEIVPARFGLDFVEGTGDPA